MGNWLKKILTPPATTGKPGVPDRASGKNPLPANPLRRGPQPQKSMPNASVIYGIGASLLFVASFSLLWNGRFLPAFLVLFIGGCIAGFALHYLKHPD